MTKAEHIKLKSVRASNVKGLKACHVEMDEETNSVIIEGANAAGKSSLLDAIAWTLLGKRSMPDDPLPDDEESGEIELGTTGDFVITRKITEADSYLEIRSEDGDEYSSPQSMLNDMIGELIADPYQFRSDSPRQIRETFLEIIDHGLDLDEWEQKKDDLYEKRKRARRKLEGHKEELAEEPQPDPDLPTETISAADLIEEIDEAEEVRRQKEQLRRDIEDRKDDIEKMKRDIDRKFQEIDELKAKIKGLQHDIDVKKDQISDEKAALSEEKDRLNRIEVPDVDEKRQKLEQIEEKNDRIREKQQYLEKVEKKEEAKREFENLEAEIEDLWSVKREAIESADFPVDGLTVKGDKIAWQGVEISECSQAERLYLYTALAIAQNPDLRCFFLPDASLLDPDWYDRIRSLAGEHDYQIFFEMVEGRSGDDADCLIQIKEGDAEVRE